jgi:hypothetical protein
MIHASSDSSDRKEIEKEVDEDIKKFAEWFEKNIKSGPLINAEIAVLKTYLFYKIIESPSSTSSG